MAQGLGARRAKRGVGWRPKVWRASEMEAVRRAVVARSETAGVDGLVFWADEVAGVGG